MAPSKNSTFVHMCRLVDFLDILGLGVDKVDKTVDFGRHQAWGGGGNGSSAGSVGFADLGENGSSAGTGVVNVFDFVDFVDLASAGTGLQILGFSTIGCCSDCTF